MADFVYAVHTDVCTYLLDDNGICTWVLSPNPDAAGKLTACIGGQFVACVDPQVDGCLVGELKEGLRALLVASGKDGGRAQLLRTGRILRVQLCEGRTAVDPMAWLDGLEELEVEADEEVSPQEAKRIEQLEEAAARIMRDYSAIVISEEAPVTRPTPPKAAPKPATRPAQPRAPAPPAEKKPQAPRPVEPSQATRGGKQKPSPSEKVGLPAPRKPGTGQSTADDTLRLAARKAKR